MQLCQVKTRFQQTAAGREESQALRSSGVEQDERAQDRGGEGTAKFATKGGKERDLQCYYWYSTLLSL